MASLRLLFMFFIQLLLIFSRVKLVLLEAQLRRVWVPIIMDVRVTKSKCLNQLPLFPLPALYDSIGIPRGVRLPIALLNIT
jgi:hypothetical protein